ncbi:MAG: hypothetical protein HGA45_20660 [Chloroflexales bacterium]|nr:hypothetical protein [Chloroflexales bacterium]
MSVQLTLCRLCARSRPEFLRALAKLTATYPNDLIIEELECIAACDDVPAIMLETSYYPQVSPGELIALVHQRLGEPVNANEP